LYIITYFKKSENIKKKILKKLLFVNMIEKNIDIVSSIKMC